MFCKSPIKEMVFVFVDIVSPFKFVHNCFTLSQSHVIIQNNGCKSENVFHIDVSLTWYGIVHTSGFTIVVQDFNCKLCASIISVLILASGKSACDELFSLRVLIIKEVSCLLA